MHNLAYAQLLIDYILIDYFILTWKRFLIQWYMPSGVSMRANLQWHIGADMHRDMFLWPIYFRVTETLSFLCISPGWNMMPSTNVWTHATTIAGILLFLTKPTLNLL